MSKPQKTYKLADLIREVEEKKHKIVIETEDGQTFEILPPELWDDHVFEASAANPVEEAKAVMGEDEYDRFRKAGGRATLVSYVVQQHIGGATLPESAAS